MPYYEKHIGESDEEFEDRIRLERAAKEFTNGGGGGCLGMLLLSFFLFAGFIHMIVAIGDTLYFPVRYTLPFTSVGRVETLMRGSFGVKYITHWQNIDFSFFNSGAERSRVVQRVEKGDIKGEYFAKLRIKYNDLDKIDQEYKQMLFYWKNSNWLKNNVSKITIVNDFYTVIFLRKDIDHTINGSVIKYLFSNNRVYIDKTISSMRITKNKRYDREYDLIIDVFRKNGAFIPRNWYKKPAAQEHVFSNDIPLLHNIGFFIFAIFTHFFVLIAALIATVISIRYYIKCRRTSMRRS